MLPSVERYEAGTAREGVEKRSIGLRNSDEAERAVVAGWNRRASTDNLLLSANCGRINARSSPPKPRMASWRVD
jgi:hypothetical protein